MSDVIRSMDMPLATLNLKDYQDFSEHHGLSLLAESGPAKHRDLHCMRIYIPRDRGEPADDSAEQVMTDVAFQVYCLPYTPGPRGPDA